MSSPDNRVDALASIFPEVLPLPQYISIMTGLNLCDDVKFPQMTLVMKDNFLLYKVIPPANDESQRIDIPHDEEQGALMNEILTRFIDQQVRTSRDYKLQNCLTLGYRSTSAHSMASVRHNANLECFYVNTLHVYFNNPLWIFLAKVLGEKIIRHLLSQTMFVTSTNGSYLQISGIPMANLIHIDSSKSRIVSNNKIDKKIILNTTEIPHRTIFYNQVYEKNIGLPHMHHFERVNIYLPTYLYAYIRTYI